MNLEAMVERAAGSLSLELFTFLGGMVEEIVAPIPSPIIGVTAGSLAQYKGLGYAYLAWLAALGAAGKTIGALLLYFAAVKFEDFILARFGRFLGISRTQVDKLSARLNQGWKDDVTLTALRALPFVPSSILSVGCGLLKIRLRTVLISSLAGNFFRNCIFLYIGYAGKSSYEALLHGMDSVESVMKVIILAGIAGLVGWVYFKRSKDDASSGPRSEAP